MPRTTRATRTSTHTRRLLAATAALLLTAGLFSCSAILGLETLSGPEGAPDAVAPTVDATSDVPAVGITVRVSVSQPTSTFGDSVTFTAVVFDGGTPAAGAVTFSEAGLTLGALPLAGGTASLTTSALSAGTHTITATFGGDAASARSVSHEVQRAATTTQLASAPNPSTVGQAVRLTATVTAVKAPGDVSGLVSFKSGATSLGTATATKGTATLDVTTLAGGLHDLVATYEGSANLAGSASPSVRQAVTGPACEGVASNCGLAGNASCCASEAVPGGTFSRSYDGVSSGYTNPANTATVGDFRLDVYEVTVSRFRAFVQAGKGTMASPPAPDAGAHPSIPTSGWRSAFDAGLVADRAALTAAIKCSFPAGAGPTWTDAVGPNETKPINCVTWFEAFAFCAWDGGRLPTEAEWNYAAAAGAEQRVRPWSSPANSTTVDQTFAVFDAVAPLAVGSKPAGNGLWKHADLAGNVWEWTLDWQASYLNPCVNCANLTPAASRIFRGGGFLYSAVDTLASRRGSGQPTYRGGDVGIRCARTP